MAVKLRLARRGRKKLPIYDIIAADTRAPRDGRFIEKLGSYSPHTHPAITAIKEEKAIYWLLQGAQPTNTVRNMLSSQGILLKKHLQIGVEKGSITQEEADQRWQVWQQTRTSNLGAPNKKHSPKAQNTSNKASHLAKD